MLRLFAVMTALVIAFLPASAYACSGFIDCLFGFTERTEVRNERMIEVERIEAQRDAEVAKAQAQAQERVKEAEAEVERVRQLQYETESQRDIAIAEAQHRAEEYKAMIAGLTQERVTAIMAESDQQLASLQHAAEIHIAGITETGTTERWRIAGGWIFASLLVVAIAAIIILWLHKLQNVPSQPIYVLPSELDRLRQLAQRRELQSSVRNNAVVQIEREY